MPYKAKPRNKKRAAPKPSRVMALRDAIRAETNSYATNSASNAISTSGTVFDLGSIAEGTANYNRSGTRVVLTGVEVRYNMVIADTTNFMRIIIGLDRRSSGALPVVTDVLDSAVYDAPLKYIFRERFMILHDRTYALSTNGNEAISMCLSANLLK